MSKRSQNSRRLFLSNATLDALKKFCVDKDTRELVAIQNLINEGLKAYLPEEVYESQKKRYSRTSRQIDEEKIWRETKRKASKLRKAKRNVDSSITSCHLQIRRLEKDIDDLYEGLIPESRLKENPKLSNALTENAIKEKSKDLDRERNRLEGLYKERENLKGGENQK